MTSSFMIDVEEMVDRTIDCIRIARERPVPPEDVLEGIFTFLDGYIQSKMRWAEHPGALVNHWCEGIGVDWRHLYKDSGHHRVASFLELEFNFQFAGFLPGRTWHVISIRRWGKSSLMVLEIGEDYRILEWMKENRPDETIY